MEKAQENPIRAILATMFVLAFALISGLSVVVGLYADRMGFESCKSWLVLVAWLAATCILWSTPFIMQRIRKNGEVAMDERGLKIFKNAALVAVSVSMLYFLSVCFVARWIVGPNGSVSVNVIPAIFVGWIVIFQIALVFSNLILDRLG
jgi:hypothetical protein